MKTMVSTRIEDQIRQELEKIGEEEDRSISSVIRRILIAWLQENRDFKLSKKKAKNSHQRPSQKVRKERPIMTIMIYKDYEIEATAEQLDDNTGWSASVRIYAHDGSQGNGKVFKISEKHINQEEAIKHGLILGQRIIDGRVEDCSIEDI